MIQGESPKIIFDLIMTRFEDSYNPIIIYDVLRCIKEYGLDREPSRFKQLRFAPEPLYGDNLTTLAKYDSTRDPGIQGIEDLLSKGM